MTATSGDKQATLNWSPVAGANHYFIYMTESAGIVTTPMPWLSATKTYLAAVVSATTYTQTGLTNGSTQAFIVTAADKYGSESAPTEQALTWPSAP